MTPETFVTFLLAFIQSATEFLPVSSSAHLILAQSFHLTNQGIFSDVALHAGTLLAVLIYFERDVRQMIVGLFRGGPERKLLFHLIIATIPVIVAVLVGSKIIFYMRLPVIIAGTSIIFGILLWLADKFTYVNTDLRSMKASEAFCIGLAQVLSLVPGVSRSGITITCCRALGFSRRDSTRFAMLLSIPAISAASIYVIGYAWYENTLSHLFNMEVFTGTVCAAIMGLIVIRFLMQWVRRSSFAVFAVYRVILGLVVWYYFLF